MPILMNRRFERRVQARTLCVPEPWGGGGRAGSDKAWAQARRECGEMPADPLPLSLGSGRHRVGGHTELAGWREVDGPGSRQRAPRRCRDLHSPPREAAGLAGGFLELFGQIH